ncbi:MAG: universal stress protein [Planctomycetota bacterium]|nr:MAG: universal stress protein [Planctomycetota bacterium]
MHIERILVATDLKPDSEACWASVCGLARACGAEVFLMRAVTEPEFTPAFDIVARPALREFDELRERGRAEGVKVSDEFVIASGDPPASILRVARERDADLIVVGAHTGIGFTADQVLGYATRPVWFVRPSDCEPPTSIICAADMGPMALRALEMSAWLAATFEVPLTVLRVEEEEKDAGPDRLAALAEEIRERALAFCDKVDLRATARAGTLGGCLIEEIRKSGADLLVMGSAGRTGIARLRKPNRSEWALRHAPASLLVVKHPASE